MIGDAPRAHETFTESLRGSFDSRELDAVDVLPALSKSPKRGWSVREAKCGRRWLEWLSPISQVLHLPRALCDGSSMASLLCPIASSLTVSGVHTGTHYTIVELQGWDLAAAFGNRERRRPAGARGNASIGPQLQREPVEHLSVDVLMLSRIDPAAGVR